MDFSNRYVNTLCFCWHPYHRKRLPVPNSGRKALVDSHQFWVHVFDSGYVHLALFSLPDSMGTSHMGTHCNHNHMRGLHGPQIGCDGGDVRLHAGGSSHRLSNSALVAVFSFVWLIGLLTGKNPGFRELITVFSLDYISDFLY